MSKPINKYSARIHKIAYLLMSLFMGCSKDEALVAGSIDEQLFKESTSTSTNFSWYKGSDKLIERSSASPHNLFMRTKFDPIAQAALGSDGKLPEGASFPKGSLIVKELFDKENGSLALIASMKKDPDSEWQGSGWIWGEYNPEGTTAFSAEKKGSGCISCHSSGKSRDLTRLFDLH